MPSTYGYAYGVRGTECEITLLPLRSKEAMPGWGLGRRCQTAGMCVELEARDGTANFASKKVGHQNSKGLKRSAFLHFLAGSA